MQGNLPLPKRWILLVGRVPAAAFYRLYFRLRCEKDPQQIARVVNRDRPAIIVFNHSSYLDVPAVALCLGMGVMQRVLMPGKKELFQIPVLSWCLRNCGAIPLDRDLRDVRAVRTLLRGIQSGRILLMAPEGTRSPDGHVRPFKSGFVKIAHRAGAVVLPVGIQGAAEALPRGGKFPKPRPLTVRIGSVMDVTARLPPKPTPDDYDALAETIRQRVIALAGKSYSSESSTSP